MKKVEPESRTRTQVARAILEGGPSTAVDLATRLSITPAGIRRHLDALVEEGILTSREPYQSQATLESRGRGRPAKVFLMTDLGRETFEHSYDDLALSALRFIASQNPQNSVRAFADHRALDIENRAKSHGGISGSLESKSDALAEFLTQEGFAATATKTPNGVQLCQNHCPVAHVAAQFPELCESETQALSRLVGTHVQRLATIAHGDGVCTTFIPQFSNNITSEQVVQREKKEIGAHA